MSAAPNPGDDYALISHEQAVWLMRNGWIKVDPDDLPPGLVVSEDGGTLNWRGENYVRQADPDDDLDDIANDAGTNDGRAIVWAINELTRALKAATA